MKSAPRIGLIAALLLFHFYTRYSAGLAIPFAQRNEGMYSYVYRVALSVVAGRGFSQISFPETSEAAPLRDFTTLQRGELTLEELALYFKQPYSSPIPESVADDLNKGDLPRPDSEFINEHHRTRVLDLYLAAYLWKWLGIRWPVYFMFYTLVSTLAALCAFLLARKIGGYWTGVFALLLYTACPLEMQYTFRGVRDISPLWFALFSFTVTLCVAGSFRSRAFNIASYAAAGFVAVLGYGWRPDALILPPILLLLLTGYLSSQGRRLGEVILAGVLFISGSALCWTGIRMITPEGGVSPQHGFHMAYYGHAVRANLFGLEDSRKVFRCDVNTRLEAQYYAKANGMAGGGQPYLSPAYGAACRAMLVEALQYDAWPLVSRFPVFLFQAMRGTGLRDLPVNHDYFPRNPRLTGAAAWSRRLLLDPLYAAAPYLTVLGLAGLFFWIRPVFLPASLAAFLAGYSLILLAVLPEFKHTGVLVLPMCVLSSMAVTTLFSGKQRSIRWKSGLTALVVIGAAWTLCSGLAYFTSRSSRRQLLAAIRDHAAHAPPTDGLLTPHLFHALREPGSLPDRIGYLFEIEAGASPGLLYSRGRRDGADTRSYESRHALHPNLRQYFFLTSYFGEIEKIKAFSNTVLVEGDAKILSVRRMDLNEWKELEASTVFYEGEDTPGSPRAPEASNRTTYGPLPLDDLLLATHERLTEFPRKTHPLILSGPKDGALKIYSQSAGDGIFSANLLRPSPTARTITNGALILSTPPEGGQAYWMSPTIDPDDTRPFYITVRYRLRKGNLVLAAFPVGVNTPLGICHQAQATKSGGIWTETVAFNVHQGQPFVFLLANGYEPLDVATTVELIDIRLFSDSGPVPPL